MINGEWSGGVEPLLILDGLVGTGLGRLDEDGVPGKLPVPPPLPL